MQYTRLGNAHFTPECAPDRNTDLLGSAVPTRNNYTVIMSNIHATIFMLQYSCYYNNSAVKAESHVHNNYTGTESTVFVVLVKAIVL